MEDTVPTDFFITKDTSVSDAVLNTIAHMPTEHLPKLVDPAFFQKLADQDFMRIGTLLAQKSYDEGGCPIGGVIIDNKTRQIIGKGHNTLGQENDSTTHGETAALRDAGRVAMLKGEGPVDFRKTTMFTTLTPCVVCCAQICNRCNFEKVVIGDITNAPSTEKILRDGSIQNVQILEDPKAVALYKEYSEIRPDLHYIDWAGHKKWDEAQASGLVPKSFAAKVQKPRGNHI
jgi:cytosine deaminase